MVWGEERPVRSAFPVAEVLAVFGLVLLTIYIVSDPIGRSAAKSYEAAAQHFIQTRDDGQNLVSRDNVDVKDMALQSTFLSPDPIDATKVDFDDYQNEILPVLDTQDLDVAVRIELTGTEGQEPIQEIDEVEPLVVEAMEGTMKQLLDNEDDTIFDVPRDCEGTDRLIGLCDGLELKELVD